MIGDRSAIQGYSLGFQGSRESRSAQQGQVRHETFQVELEGAINPLYAPSERFQSKVHAIIECRFALTFIEKPMVKADVSLKWEDTNGDEGQEWDDLYQPVITHCVVNWKRPSGMWLFQGADVMTTVWDHPWGAKMIARLTFSGMALATPYPGVPDLDDSTTRV